MPSAFGYASVVRPLTPSSLSLRLQNLYLVPQLRLSSSRIRLFQQPRTYCRQFLKQKRLVSKEFLQSLERETRSLSMPSNGSASVTMGPDIDEFFAPSPSEASSTNWAALGAAVLAGCVLGAVATSERHRVLRRFFT